VGQKILEYVLFRILQNVIEKSFINWPVLSLVKINTRISETPRILKHSWFNRSLENFVFKNWYLWHNYQYGCHMSISTLLLTEVFNF
jgi:hypothetical protein